MSVVVVEAVGLTLVPAAKTRGLGSGDNGPSVTSAGGIATCRVTRSLCQSAKAFERFGYMSLHF